FDAVLLAQRGGINDRGNLIPGGRLLAKVLIAYGQAGQFPRLLVPAHCRDLDLANSRAVEQIGSHYTFATPGRAERNQAITMNLVNVSYVKASRIKRQSAHRVVIILVLNVGRPNVALFAIPISRH